ncbi:MAG: hypothetical protein Ta2B_05330 [Termitinemataceae bacterium]|nr:MAG: hypothetical protein Ta2B_05330 [Termitinemataceae bacterium]
MKKEKVILTILLCAFIFAFIGCATTPIENQYPERWEKTKVGMTLEEFKTVWPNAKYGGYALNGDEVYSVSSKVPYGNSVIEYFIFENGKLTKWKSL